MGEPIRVLAVDDQPEFADLTATVLEHENDRFVVETATSASEGLDRLAADIDCIVSDYVMPGQNGIEFLAAVREGYPDLPFILFTGKGSEDVASEAISTGATDYLRKRTGSDQYTVLANRIENAVEQYRARRRAAAQERINVVVQEINEALVRATSHEEINERVCEILSEADPYRAAWIGEVVDCERIEPLAAAGAAKEYLAEVSVTIDESPTGQGPGGRAVRERHIVVSQNLQDDPSFEPWREAAVERGFRAVAAIPLEYEDELYGLLGVYADEPNAFDADERALLAQLGETIGHAHHRVRIQDQYEGQYRELFEQAPVMFTFTRNEDGEPIIEDCNRQFADRLGYDREELRGRPLADVYTDASTRILLEGEGYERALAGEFVREERTFVTRDGEHVTTLLRATPRRDQDGEIIGTHALFVDISDEERARELELTRDRMEFALNATDSIIFEVDLDTRTETQHGPFKRLFGVPSGEVSTADEFYEQCVHPGDRDRVERLQQPDVLSDESGTLTYEFRTHPDRGEVRWIRSEAYVDTDANGEPRRLIGIDTDVTERGERERELERYRTLVEASGDPLFTLDADGTVTFVNEAFVDLTGYTREDLVGSDPSMFTTEEDIEQGKDVIRTLLSSSADRETFEIDVITADGERVPCENHVALLPFDEEFQGTVAVLRDITNRKERNRKLQRQNERLEAFASVVSHDLRNPLNVAQLRLDMVREECGSEHIDHIEEAHERMRTLIEDLLTAARSGDTVDEVEQVDLAALIERCWDAVTTPEATLVVETDRTIRADPDRLRQLLENLIRNAIEHEGAGVTITIGDLDDGFYVADDGPGIPEGEHDRIFEYGYSTSEEGVGLGLAIVKEIVDAHGWGVSVTESAEGGARFEITGVETVE